jgi:Holliday junction resolvase RusA-like endonuclease
MSCFLTSTCLVVNISGSATNAIDLLYSSDDVESSAVGGSLRQRSKRGRPKKKKEPIFFSNSDASAFSYTTNRVYFEVAGRPLHKKRAARGKNNNCYNPSRSEEKEFASVVKDIFVERLGRVPTFQRTLALTVDVRFLFPDRGSSIFATADIDNLCKFVLDALNGILYNDDRQIVTLNSSKLFDSSHQLGCTTVAISIPEAAPSAPNH